MDKPTDLLPGDLIFYAANLDKSPIGILLLTWLQNVIGQSPIHEMSYSHVGIVDYDCEHLLESTWPKSRVRAIDWAKEDERHDVHIYRLKNRDEEVIYKALRWCHENTGQWYDLGVLLIGFLDVKHAEICSTFVQKAFNVGGVEVSVEGSGKKLTTPDEIAANIEILERIQ